MIEILVVLLVLGAATVVFYPALAGNKPVKPAGKAGTGKGAPPAMDEDVAEQHGLLVEHRNRVLRNLAELDTERAAGRLAESDYADLKRRDEAEAAKAIHQLETFEAEQKAGRKKGHGKPQTASGGRRWGPVLGWVGGTAAFAVILGITMAKSVAPRAEGGTITGDMPGGGSAPEAPSPVGTRSDPVRLAKLEKAIKSDSSNLKNLLEAGHLYLAERRLDDAAQVTIKALSLDSEAPEGLAHIAMLLFAEGSSQQDHPDSAQRAFNAAVDAADRAIRAKPDLAEAWLFKGMIMMAGKRDPKAAAQAWEQYLKVAPPDADTTRIHAMVEASKRGSGP